MRPPAYPRVTGKMPQKLPRFGIPSGPTPAPKKAYHCKLNTDDMMTQACHRGHEKNSMPLRPANHLRTHNPSGGFVREPPRPKLAKPIHVKIQPLVTTF